MLHPLPLSNTPARKYAEGIGDAVADRTVNRNLLVDKLGTVQPFEFDPNKPGTVHDQMKAIAAEKGWTVRRETWEEVAYRVALGNTLLHKDAGKDFERLHHHLRQASTLLSGRHLQHGDQTQPTRPQEVFTNCSTAASTFLTFYLLLNGSGVGRCYDDDMMVVDYRRMPIVVPVIDMSHRDVQSGEIKCIDLRNAQHLYQHAKQHVFQVPDSREGWAQAIEKIETMTYLQKKNDVLILDFSNVRPRNTPIKGMQNRPASGPGPLMAAIENIARLRNAGMEPWRAAMYADHYAAECVLVGGARRAARMATKSWRDADVLDFIQVKRGGFLWSSNNSVTVDEEFWGYVKDTKKVENVQQFAMAGHAIRVFNAICEAAYHDGTGEPGFINVDRLSWNPKGIQVLMDGEFAESARLKLSDEAQELNAAIARRWKRKQFKVITNPCGEIVLPSVGGYCVIADVVPFHAGAALDDPDNCEELMKRDAAWDDDAEDAFRTATRALIRTNMMDSLYSKEVKRSNRIGVGFTGLHEYAYARFGYGWKDMIDEERSKDFWMTLARFARAVRDEAIAYSAEVGVEVPHTMRTVKPAGTTSKLFGLTEGAHLPAMREYLRWVQFRNDDPLVQEYAAKGYPVRKLQTYSGTTIVGFPTQPTICKLDMGEKLVTADEATPEEQYQYLRLLEKYWIVGVDEQGNPLPDSGNQVSYTLKYDPKKVSYDEFCRVMKEQQSTVRCCSVMPKADTSAYEYLPETAVSKHEFELIAQAIASVQMKEEVDFAHVDCSTGACPIDFENRE